MIPSGFEPETHSLEGCCSIQLSYGTIILLKAVQRYKKSLQLQNFFYVAEKSLLIPTSYPLNSMIAPANIFIADTIIKIAIMQAASPSINANFSPRNIVAAMPMDEPTDARESAR